MDKLKLALIGCGGMGTRHLYGLRELAKTPFNNIELCALCDLSRDNAELAAREAEQLLGSKPPVFTSMEAMAQAIPDLMAVEWSLIRRCITRWCVRHWTWGCTCWLKSPWLFL